MKQRSIWIGILFTIAILLLGGCGYTTTEVQSEIQQEENNTEDVHVENLVSPKPLQSMVPYQGYAWRIADVGENSVLQAVEKQYYVGIDTGVPSPAAAETVVRNEASFSELEYYTSLTFESNGERRSFVDVVASRYPEEFFVDHDLLLFQINLGQGQNRPELLDFTLNMETGRYELNLQCLHTTSDNMAPARWCIAMEVEKDIIGVGEAAFPLVKVMEETLYTDMEVLLGDSGELSFAGSETTIVKDIEVPGKLAKTEFYEILSPETGSLIRDAYRAGLLDYPMGKVLISSEADFKNTDLYDGMLLWPYLAPGDPASTESDPTLSFESFTESYDGEYFEKKDLFLFLIRQADPLGSYTVSDLNWNWEKERYEMQITVRKSGRENVEWYRDSEGAMRDWLVAVEVEKGRLNGMLPDVVVTQTEDAEIVSAIYRGNGVSLAYRVMENSGYRFKTYMDADFVGLRLYFDGVPEEVFAEVGYYPNGFIQTEAESFSSLPTFWEGDIEMGMDKDGKWIWMDFEDPSGCYGGYLHPDISRDKSLIANEIFRYVSLASCPHDMVYEDTGPWQPPLQVRSPEKPESAEACEFESLLLVSEWEKAETKQMIIRSESDLEQLPHGEYRVWPFQGAYNPELGEGDPRVDLKRYLIQRYDQAFFREYDLYLYLGGTESSCQVREVFLDTHEDTGKSVILMHWYPAGGEGEIAGTGGGSENVWVFAVALKKGTLTGLPEIECREGKYVLVAESLDISVEYPSEYEVHREDFDGDRIIRVMLSHVDHRQIVIGTWKKGFKPTKAAYTKKYTNQWGRRVTVGYDQDGVWIWMDYNHSSGKKGTHNYGVTGAEAEKLFDLALNVKIES
ncbi:MAG: hypothetical protein E7428_00880 [Ruminococcaceae bacterium]|nr:hypothetical protein [Oscillospiraceae bacterium]